MSDNKLPYHYDDERGLLINYSYSDFIKTLALLQTKNPIDVEKTLANINYNIVHKDNSCKQYYRWPNLFIELEEYYGIKHDVTKSNMAGYMFFLRMEKPVFEESKSVEKEVTQPTQDFSEYEDLLDESNVRDSKANLAERAKKDFGVSLKKNQPFDKMIEQLKSLIS